MPSSGIGNQKVPSIAAGSIDDTIPSTGTARPVSARPGMALLGSARSPEAAGRHWPAECTLEGHPAKFRTRMGHAVHSNGRYPSGRCHTRHTTLRHQRDSGTRPFSVTASLGCAAASAHSAAASPDVADASAPPASARSASASPGCAAASLHSAAASPDVAAKQTAGIGTIGSCIAGCGSCIGACGNCIAELCSFITQAKQKPVLPDGAAIFNLRLAGAGDIRTPDGVNRTSDEHTRASSGASRHLPGRSVPLGDTVFLCRHVQARPLWELPGL